MYETVGAGVVWVHCLVDFERACLVRLLQVAHVCVLRLSAGCLERPKRSEGILLELLPARCTNLHCMMWVPAEPLCDSCFVGVVAGSGSVPFKEAKKA